MSMKKKTVLSSLFALWILVLPGFAQAEYARDCKVDWLCHGPNLCAKSDMELSLAISGDYVGLEFGHGGLTDLYLVDGETENRTVYSGFDSDGNYTVMSSNFKMISTDSGRMFVSKHSLPGGDDIFTDNGGLSTAYLTCGDTY